MIVIEAVIYAFYPIVISHSSKIMPPILFAGLTTLVAAVTSLIFVIRKATPKTLLNPRTLKYAIGITIFIIVIPSLFIFTGSSKTSGINTTILLQSEILFTFIFFGILKLEKITSRKILGSIIAIAGTSLILYNGSAKINIGDILIICGTISYPIGNFLAKKALKKTSIADLIFLRSIFGGIILIAFSLIFENQQGSMDKIALHWPLIVGSGIFINHISKFLWYQGIKRIDVSKAIPLSAGIYPTLSFIFALIFLHESPTFYQITGFALAMCGIFTLLEKKKL